MTQYLNEAILKYYKNYVKYVVDTCLSQFIVIIGFEILMIIYLTSVSHIKLFFLCKTRKLD